LLFVVVGIVVGIAVIAKYKNKITWRKKFFRSKQKIDHNATNWKDALKEESDDNSKELNKIDKNDENINDDFFIFYQFFSYYTIIFVVWILLWIFKGWTIAINKTLILSLIFIIIDTRFIFFRFLLFIPKYEKHHLIYDERYIFPIPFLSRILLSYVKKKNLDYAVNLSIYTINNHKIHKRQAQKGLLLIILNEFEKFNELQQIQNIKTNYQFLSNLEFFNDEDLNQFQILISISEDLKNALIESTFSNKVRIFEKSIEKLNDLKKLVNLTKIEKQKNKIEAFENFLNNPFGTDKIKPIYYAFENIDLVLEKWKLIIKNTINEIESNGKLPISNPFIVGKPIKNEVNTVFISRKDIIEQIQNEALREAETGGILFVGNRRTGKSSTLLNMQPYLHSSLKSVYFDCQSPKLTDSQHFSLTVSKTISETLNLPVNNKITDFALLTDFFEEVQQKLFAQNNYLLICFDEYEKFNKLVLEKKLDNLTDSFRYWIQHLNNFIFLFAGSHSVEELKEINWSDYLINLRTVRISYLDEKSSLQLITNPIPNFGLIYETEEISQNLAKQLGGLPYLMQATMFELVNILNNDDCRKIAYQTDIDNAIEKMFVSANEYFSYFWSDEINKDMQTILLELIKTETIKTENKTALRNLLIKEIIIQDAQNYKFAVPIIKTWIEKNII